MGNEQFINGMWEYSRRDTRSVATEPRFREVLEQVKGNADVGCGSQMMPSGYLALREGNYSKTDTGKKKSHRSGTSKEYAKQTKKWREMKLDVWKLRTSEEKTRHQSTEWEESRCRMFARTATGSRWRKDYICWVSTGHGVGNNRKKKHCNWWCEVCGGKHCGQITPAARHIFTCRVIAQYSRHVRSAQGA